MDPCWWTTLKYPAGTALLNKITNATNQITRVDLVLLQSAKNCEMQYKHIGKICSKKRNSLWGNKLYTKMVIMMETKSIWRSFKLLHDWIAANTDKKKGIIPIPSTAGKPLLKYQYQGWTP